MMQDIKHADPGNPVSAIGSSGGNGFTELRSKGGPYVDKTRLVVEMLRNRGTEVFLFTRPHGFGKSLNLGMLDAFLNREYRGNGWFDGLEVMGCGDCVAHMNSYPVIMLDLGGLDVGSSDGFETAIEERLRMLYNRFGYLRGSDRLTGLQGVNYADVVDHGFVMTLPSESLKNLGDMLRAHHGRDVVVLVDGYDDPVVKCRDADVRRRVTALLGSMLTNVLKGNGSLAFGVVTGVERIEDGAMSSGLNNMYVDDIRSDRFGGCFGFTEDEVVDLLRNHGCIDRLEGCRRRCGGYRSGDSVIYNPGSVLRLIGNRT